MAIKYVEVNTQKWDTWLVKLNDEEYPTEEEQLSAAYEAAQGETEYDEAEAKNLNSEEVLKYNAHETIEQHYARHYGRDHVIDYTEE